MAGTRARLRTMKLSLEEETVEGTPVAETANGAILLHADGAEFDISRELIENDFMTGSFSRTAPSAGMWSDDLGLTIPTLMRGIGTLSTHGPDYQMLLKSLFGSEERTTAGTVDAGSTAIAVEVKTGGTDLVDGQLLYFADQSAVRRVVSEVGTTITLDVALPAIPSEDDTFATGVNWMLDSDTAPFFTAYGYFDGPKRLRYTSCKCVSWEATFEVGANVPMSFTCKALAPLYDTTAQAITPNYDTSTVPLTCLGVSGWVRLAGTATGTPTTTETILLAPDYEVAIGDSIMIQVSAGVWETKAISAVTGNAGSNTTLTHAAVSIAASASDQVFIMKVGCAEVGQSLSITMELESESEQCMFNSAGKTGIAITGRTVTVTKQPYFKSWQPFLRRDNVVGSAFQVFLGDTANNIVAIYIPNLINTEVSLTTDALMKVDVSARAAVDSVMGNDHEIVMASF